MAEVTWIKGTIDPSQSGEYYVSLEAKQDMVDPETGLVDYFGERVQWQNGDPCPNLLAYGGGKNNADA